MPLLLLCYLLCYFFYIINLPRTKSFMYKISLNVVSVFFLSRMLYTFCLVSCRHTQVNATNSPHFLPDFPDSLKANRNFC